METILEVKGTHNFPHSGTITEPDVERVQRKLQHLKPLKW